MNTQNNKRADYPNQDTGGGHEWYRKSTQPHKTTGDNAYTPATRDHLVLPPAFVATQRDSAKQSNIKHTLTQTLTALSLDKQALQEASGTRFPPQCFGCAGLKAYEDKCNHLFRDCPHKEDPQVIENFKQSLPRLQRLTKKITQQNLETKQLPKQDHGRDSQETCRPQNHGGPYPHPTHGSLKRDGYRRHQFKQETGRYHSN
jgi:hypothetical protein